MHETIRANIQANHFFMPSAPDRLQVALARQAPASRQQLAERTGLPLRTLQRQLDALGPELLAAGQTRRRRFALRRPLRGMPFDEPVYAIDAGGAVAQLGRLIPFRPEGCHLDLSATPWPLGPGEEREGWWPGLPYPLADAQPQGFLGRLFARRHGRELQLDADPTRWSDDAVLLALRHLGADLPGHWVLGDAALELARAQWLHPAPQPESEAELASRYAELATRTMQEGIPGSSAAGEFPKFITQRHLEGAATPHCIVKYSGADLGSATVQRWSDLLVCEHLALQALAQLPGLMVARSRILQGGGRTFLESERFDRHGRFGRSPVVSLLTVDAALLGQGGDWPQAGHALRQAGWIRPETLQRIEWMHWFGRLIANSDMHAGNLGLVPQRHEGRPMFELAPAYDMLPMAYAPLGGGELPQREFTPPLPSPAQTGAWRLALPAACAFWSAAATDARISSSFRQVAADNLLRLQRVAELPL